MNQNNLLITFNCIILIFIIFYFVLNYRLLFYSENGNLEDKVRIFCAQMYSKGNRSIYLLSCFIDLLDADVNSTEIDNVEKVKFALKVRLPA